MMAGPVLGTGYVQIMPNFTGMQRQVGRQLTAATVPAGKTAGRAAGVAAGSAIASNTSKTVGKQLPGAVRGAGAAAGTALATATATPLATATGSRGRIGRAFATIPATAGRSFRSMQTLGSRAAATMGSAFTRNTAAATTGIAGMHGGLRSMAKTASGLVAAVGLYQLGKAGFDSAVGVEKSTAALKGLYGSGTIANKVVGQLRTQARGSPIEYASFLRGAENLAYLGVEGDKAIPILKQIETGLVASGKGGEEMDSVTDALLGMANQGKASADELNRVSQAGMPIWSMMAAEAGKSIMSVRKDVEKGKVPIEQVLKAIEDGGGETFAKMTAAAEAGSRTFSATWRRTKDNVVVAIGDMIKPLLGRMTPALARMGPQVEASLGRLPATFARIGDTLSNVGVTDAIASIARGVGAMIKGLMPLAGGLITGIGVAFSGLVLALRPLGALLQLVGNWMARNKTIMGALGVTVGVVAGAFGALLLVTKAWSAATKIAAAVQVAFNAVMAMNPIGLVVIAIAALAAGVVYAYQKSETFRNIVQGAFNAVASAGQWMWNTILKPAFMGIRAGVTAIGTAATWLWRNAVQPAFNGITTAGKLLFAILATVVITPIRLYLRALGAVFQWLWRTVVRPVFQNIGKLAVWLWRNVILPNFTMMKAGIRLLGSVFQWLWRNIVSPVFRAIGSLAVWLWRNVIMPNFNVMKAGIRALGSVFQWLNRNVVQPVFRGVASIVQWAWRNVVKPNFDAIKAGIRAVGSVFAWLRDNIVRPVWNGIRTIISGVWSWMNGAFGKIKKGVGLVGRAFSGIKNTIKKAWDAIPGIVYRPVNWFLNNIYTKGIKQTFDKIAKAVKLKISLPEAPKLGSYATGGRIGGVGTGTSDSNLIWASKDEFVVREKIAKKIGYPALEALNRGRLDYNLGGAYAKGGRVYPTKYKNARTYPGHRNAGAYDFAMPIGTRVGSTEAGKVIKVKTLAGSFGKHMDVGHSGGWMTRYAHLSRFVAKLGQQVVANSHIANSGNTGNSTGPHLHFEAHKNGRSTNALSYLKGAPAGQGGFFGGIAEFIKDGFKKARSVGGWLKDKGQALADLASNAAGALKKWIGDKVHKMLGNIPGADTMLGKSLAATPKFIISGLVDKTKDLASKLLPTASGDVGSTGLSGGTAGKNQAIAKALLPRFGWGANQFGPLKTLWHGESGWNHRAANPSSGAYGIPQSLPGSKMATVGADWRTNPETQIKWGMRYIKGRYGTPSGALSAWNARSPHWYDKGVRGPGLPPGASMVYNGTRQTEPVVTSAQWDTIVAAARNNSDAGGDQITFNARTIDLDERRLRQAMDTIRLRQRVGRPR